MIFRRDLRHVNMMKFFVFLTNALLYALCAFIVIIGPESGWADEDTVTLAADEWCPYNCAPGDEKPGYIVEIARKIFETKGYRIIYRATPWESAVKAGRIGRYDGVIGATKVDGRGFVFPEEEVGISSNDFFVKAGDPWRFQSVASLKNKRLGVIKGYDYGETMNRFISDELKADIQMVSWDNAVELNLKKLVSGRIDVLLDDRNVIRYIAARMGVSDEIAYAGSNGKRQYLYIAFSPAVSKSREYASILTDGIRSLRKTGELAGILSKYGLTDWK